ncbi:MAG: manganese efflux pump [Clostridia bacterium]|nr:manganese efflux pump [Clostridia bacterium]MBR2919163.1 manganese efflux pump [Clostridia bacterium]
MPWIVQSLLISVSLSMDAFAVSLSNGLTAKKMPVKYMILTALSFGLFQGIMPLIGYLLGSLFEKWIEVAVPIIGFCILFLLGAKMIFDSVRDIMKEKKAKEKETDNLSCPNCLDNEEKKPYKFGVKTLLVQSVATSIDALTVGLVYIGKSPLETYVTFALIAVITFGICVGGVFIGQKFGDKLKSKSGILGGLILIAIGLKLLIEFLIERF